MREPMDTHPPVRVEDRSGIGPVVVIGEGGCRYSPSLDIDAPVGLASHDIAAILHALSQPRVPEGMTAVTLRRIADLIGSGSFGGYAATTSARELLRRWANEIEPSAPGGESSTGDKPIHPAPRYGGAHIPDLAPPIGSTETEYWIRRQDGEPIGGELSYVPASGPDDWSMAEDCESRDDDQSVTYEMVRSVQTVVATSTYEGLDDEIVTSPCPSSTADDDEPIDLNAYPYMADPPAPSTERVPWWEAFARDQPIKWPDDGRSACIKEAVWAEQPEGDPELMLVPADGGYRRTLESWWPDGTVEVLKDEPKRATAVDVVHEALMAVPPFGPGTDYRPEARAAISAYRSWLGCGDDDVLVPLPKAWVEAGLGSQAARVSALVDERCAAALEREER